MVDKEEEEEKVVVLFKVGQDLGHPSVFPPVIRGKIGASVQFIIPGLKLSKDDNRFITQLSGKCGMGLCGFDTKLMVTKDTKQPGTLVTLAFYVVSNNKEEENNRVISYNSRLLVERFLGLLSFFAGMKLSFVNLQITTVGKEKGHFVKLKFPAARGDMPPVTTKFSIPDLDSIVLPEIVFSALLWLRRGLAQERDPIETFSSLMVCLQIMARYIESEEPKITSQMRKLIVSGLGRSPDLFKRIWKTRSAIVAHGNKPVTPDVLRELTELKFEAAVLAYQSIKLSLGMPLDSPPSPNQRFFITDCFMHYD